MKIFMNDIEEDIELRANINLYKVSLFYFNFYKDDNVIEELEKQLAAMTISNETKKSPIGTALEEGKAKVGGQERKIVKAARKTNQGKQNEKDAEAVRKKNEMMFKATLKKEEDSDWESVEEDFPHVKLEELLANLKLDDGPKVQSDSEEEEKKE